MTATKTILIAIITMAATFLLNSCKPDATTCNNCETELITTLNVQLTDSATGAVSNFAFIDPDGDGANAPVQFDTIVLTANHTYYASLIILDASKTPADTISNEIANEANDHQFFYHVHDVTMGFTYNDYDTHVPPLPVGLRTTWNVGGVTGTGLIHILLKHQPGIKDGNQLTGDTDLEVEFNTRVQ